MQIIEVVFSFIWRGENYQVVFQTGVVGVRNHTGETVAYANKDATWKPCATHAEALIRLAFGGGPKTNVAKRRARQTKPLLQLIGGGDS